MTYWTEVSPLKIFFRNLPPEGVSPPWSTGKYDPHKYAYLDQEDVEEDEVEEWEEEVA